MVWILNEQVNNLFSNGVSYIDVWGEVGKILKFSKCCKNL